MLIIELTKEEAEALDSQRKKFVDEFMELVSRESQEDLADFSKKDQAAALKIFYLASGVMGFNNTMTRFDFDAIIEQMGLDRPSVSTIVMLYEDAAKAYYQALMQDYQAVLAMKEAEGIVKS